MNILEMKTALWHTLDSIVGMCHFFFNINLKDKSCRFSLFLKDPFFQIIYIIFLFQNYSTALI